MASKYQSPGVYSKERDLSAIVPSLATSTAVLVGYSAKGSLAKQLITNAGQFVEEYGEPIVGNYFHYSALAYLEQGNQLYCLRVTGVNRLYSGLNLVNAPAVEHNPFDRGQSSPIYYDDSGLENQLISIFAKDPGIWGDKIRITVTEVKAGDSEFDDTDKYTFKINVWYTDEEGNTAKVETHHVSRQTKIDGFGRQLYLENRINGYSKYILVADNTAVANTVVPIASDSDTILGSTIADGGSDGDAITASDIAGTPAENTGWYAFQSAEEITVRILIDSGYTVSQSAADVAIIHQAMAAVALLRLDCFCVFSVPMEEDGTIVDMLTYRATTLAGDAVNTSYAALYAAAVKINDSYNDVVISIPASGYVAAQIAYTDYSRDVWYAPAGYDTGTLNVLGADLVFNEGERDILYANQINPIQVFRGYGTVIWGQKTLQKKQSALSSINIRRMVSMVQTNIIQLLRSFVFELNNEITRFIVTSTIQDYMERLRAGGAFTTSPTDDGYLVICNEQNNTSEVIDSNEMHVDIFIKPVHAAEFIQLQTTITKTGVSFEELISRGVLF